MLQLITAAQVRTKAGGTGSEGRRGVLYQTEDERVSRLFFWDGEKHVQTGGPDPAGQRSSAAAALAGSPVGANSYELIYQHVMVGNYTYANVISYLVSARVKLVRVLYPVFSANEFIGNCFNGAVPDRDYVDGDFRQTFLSRSREVMDACAAAGLKLLVCFFWSPDEMAALNGETLVQSVKTTSKTYAMQQRFLRWFGAGFGAHPAFAAYSFGNEPNYDVAGVSAPTPGNLGAVFAGLVSTLRTYAPAAIATTELGLLPLQEIALRPTFESEAENLRVMCAGVDAVGLHIYGDGPSQGGYSFVGSAKSLNAAFGPATTNDLGYEGLPSFLSAARSLASSMGKPLWITETGVQTDVEAADKSVRRQRVLKTCATFADITLLWNVADLPAPIPNQTIWQIRPGTTLGNTMLPLIQAQNAGPTVKNKEVGGGLRSLVSKRRPQYCFSGARVGDAVGRITMTSTAAMAAVTLPALLFWVRKNAALTAFENIFDWRVANAGLNFCAGDPPATSAEYFEFRGAAGATWLTAGALPRQPDGDWYHVAAVMRIVGGVRAVELWINGMYWRNVVFNAAYVPMPNGTPLYFCGNQYDGSPVSMQDFCLASYATPDDIWSHMEGQVLPQAKLHLRASSAGLADISPANGVVTVGASATTGVA